MLETDMCALTAHRVISKHEVQTSLLALEYVFWLSNMLATSKHFDSGLDRILSRFLVRRDLFACLRNSF